MGDFLSKNALSLVGVLVGALAGFMYWKYVGCNSGTCAITSKPFNSSAYGALMGSLIFSMFKKEERG